MTRAEEDRIKTIKKAHERGDFYQEIDGFWVFGPAGEFAGFLASHELRWLADELDRLNKPIQEQLDQYFRDNENS